MTDSERMPKWLHELLFWIWDDAPEEDEAANERLLKKLCEVRGFHLVEDDQCRMPEHRFCWVCNTPTPNEPLEVTR